MQCNFAWVRDDSWVGKTEGGGGETQILYSNISPPKLYTSQMSLYKNVNSGMNK